IGHDPHAPPRRVGRAAARAHRVELWGRAIFVALGEGIRAWVKRLGRHYPQPPTGTGGAGAGDDRPLAGERVDPDFRQARYPATEGGATDGATTEGRATDGRAIAWVKGSS